MLHVYPDQMLQKSFHHGLHYLVTLYILVTHNAYFAAFHQGLHYVKKYIDLYLEIITG